MGTYPRKYFCQTNSYMSLAPCCPSPNATPWTKYMKNRLSNPSNIDKIPHPPPSDLLCFRAQNAIRSIDFLRSTTNNSTTAQRIENVFYVCISLSLTRSFSINDVLFSILAL